MCRDIVVYHVSSSRFSMKSMYVCVSVWLGCCMLVCVVSWLLECSEPRKTALLWLLINRVLATWRGSRNGSARDIILHVDHRQREPGGCSGAGSCGGHKAVFLFLCKCLTQAYTHARTYIHKRKTLLTMPLTQPLSLDQGHC